MPKVNPLGILNSKAYSMIAGIVTDSPRKQEYIHDFFDMANKYDVQGQALTSYYTALNNLKNNTSFMKKNNLNGINSFENYVADLIVKSHNAGGADINSNKEVLDTFVKRLNELYNKDGNKTKTLRARISLANQDAVNSSKIVKTSFRKKMIVRTCMLMDKLFEKGEAAYNKIYEFCKPVE